MRGRSMAVIGGAASLAAVGWARPWRYRACPSELLDEILPEYEFRDTISLEIPAETKRIMRAVRELRLRDMPAAWLLGELRYLPRHLVRRGAAADREQPLVALLRNGIGSVVLAERPDEITFGSVGRLHGFTDQAIQPISGARAFRAFDARGFQKMATSIRVTELDAGRCRVTVEHRVHAIGPMARVLFGLYWLTIKPGGAFAGWQMLRAIRLAVSRPAPELLHDDGAIEAPEVTELVRELEASFA